LDDGIATMRQPPELPEVFKEKNYVREHSNESPLIRLLRAAVLLGTMILIPGVAVCWNLLPKQRHGSENVIEAPPTDDPVTGEQETSDDDDSSSSLSQPPVLQAAPIRMECEPTLESNPATGPVPLPLSPTPDGPIKTMSWEEESRTMTVSVPLTLEEPNTSSMPVMPTIIPVSGVAPQRSFPLLESELHTLGATRYRLEKWGSRGELFRFSCYVASSEPYHYQKLFQEIDSDEIRVMERVIDDIKSWRKR